MYNNFCVLIHQYEQIIYILKIWNIILYFSFTYRDIYTKPDTQLIVPLPPFLHLLLAFNFYPHSYKALPLSFLADFMNITNNVADIDNYHLKYMPQAKIDETKRQKEVLFCCSFALWPIFFF